MPFQFDFDATNKIARCRFEGRLTDDDLKEFYKAAAEFTALTLPQAAVTDLSAVTAVEITRNAVVELAQAPPALADPARPRVIIAPNPALFGMARMFEMEGERTRPSLHVVKTEQEAWAILGIWKPKFEPFKAP